MTSNTDMLNDVLDRGVADIPALLTVIADEATEAMDHTRTVKDRLHGALALQEGARTCTVLAAAGKDFDTVCFDDGDCVIVADLPEREEWDQTLLAEAVEVIRHGWRDHPAQCVRTDIKVSKAAYGLWPAAIRQLFPSARTIDTKKPTCRIEPAGKEVA